MKTNSLSAWILAIRPYSLGNSVILILIGSALAFTDGGFRPVVALLCLVFAVTMQCTANLVNDLCDFLKGADRPDRLGPDRAFAKGYITLRAMKSGIAAFTLAACAAGAGLLALSGWNWWLLLVGASCIVFAYFYTAGPWPLAYHGRHPFLRPDSRRIHLLPPVRRVERRNRRSRTGLRHGDRHDAHD